MKWYNRVFLGFGVVILIVAAIFVTRYVMNNNFRVKDLERQLNETTAIVVKGGSGEPKTYMPEATSVPAIVDSNADTTGMVTEQNYVPHPRRYEETGIEGTKTWENLVVNDDEYLVVGGVTVNGINDGVYQGYGPGTYTVTVTNGFISVVDDDWGDEEFDFRVDQAVQYGWAHAHLSRGVIPN